MEINSILIQHELPPGPLCYAQKSGSISVTLFLNRCSLSSFSLSSFINIGNCCQARNAISVILLYQILKDGGGKQIHMLQFKQMHKCYTVFLRTLLSYPQFLWAREDEGIAEFYCSQVKDF